MSKHEEKTCPSCNSLFECKPGDILKCQCYGIAINEAAAAFIRSNYEDCLCSNCLLQLNNQLNIVEEK